MHWHHRSLCRSTSSGAGHTHYVPISQLNANAPPYHPRSLPNGNSGRSSANSQQRSPGQIANRVNNMLIGGGNTVRETARAFLSGKGGKHNVQVVFDNCSDRTFIRSDVACKLGAERVGTERLRVAYFMAEQEKAICCETVAFDLHCRDGSKQRITAALLPEITIDLVKVPIPAAVSRKLSGLHLADTLPTISSEEYTIDLLIGLDHYWHVVTGPVRPIEQGVAAVQSKVGWLVSGVTSCNSNQHQNSKAATLFIQAEHETEANEMLPEFWTLESLGIKHPEGHKKGDNGLIEEFQQRTTREDGRYYVDFPWKPEAAEMPTNRELAFRRFRSLLERLRKNPSLLEKYRGVIEEQMNRGFIEYVDEDSDPEGYVHYIGHHPVIKSDSATTKVRVVYNASASEDRYNPSLNSVLKKGPDLLGSLFGILIRFREFKTVMVGDIEKAFLMIGLHKNQRDATRFFWFDGTIDQPQIRVLRFCRVPFGIISSPFLLNASLQLHLKNYSHSAVGNLMKTNFYMDNLICSFGENLDPREFYAEAKQIMAAAQMNLREWCSNVDLSSFVPERDLTSGRVQKILGLAWDSLNDEIAVTDKHEAVVDRVCKRRVLKRIASIFDPLGFLSPVLVPGKILLQKLWKEKFSWDQELPEDLRNEWYAVEEELRQVKRFAVPRWLRLDNCRCVDVHVFCDASNEAYGTIVYSRIQDWAYVRTEFVCSKSRVAPVKRTTLPQLELMAINLGCRLVSAVVGHLTVSVGSVTVWSDSQIALCWVKTRKTARVFESNRVAEIRKSGYAFRYVPTRQNPADISSRGSKFQVLQISRLWWHGPEWLVLEEGRWPKGEPTQSELPDKGPVMLTSSRVLIPPAGMDSQRYSSIGKLLRITVYCMRVRTRQRGPIGIDEMNRALRLWILRLQEFHFSEELEHLRRNRSTGQVGKLNVFLDTDGVLRCRGRLDNADVTYDANNPVLLPKKSQVTDMIVKEEHEKCGHQRVRATLNSIRSRFWIPSGRQVVRKVLSRCVVCRRWEGKSFGTVKAPPLPRMRVEELPAFSFTGVDFAGPLHNREGGKNWVCLFTCAVTRALHLELTSDMTTHEFLLALRRFVARRGVPQKMISDNARQFKLAKQVLEGGWVKAVTDASVVDYSAKAGFKWVYNVERAPWWGGFFERLVGLVKRILRKVVGKSLLSVREIETQLIEIEGLLNARPLTFVGTDILDGSALTPQALAGSNLPRGLPLHEDSVDRDVDYLSKANNASVLTRRLRYTQRILKNFWDQFRKEYLLQLREFARDTEHRGVIPKVGEIVLVKEDVGRGKWKLGLVESLGVGRDGQVRFAELRVGKAKTRRPLQLLFPLEVRCCDSPLDGRMKDTIVHKKPERRVARQAAVEARRAIKAIAESED